MDAESYTAAPARPAVRGRSGRRDLVDVSLFVFAADLVWGMVAPTFSLFVRDLGGSPLAVGVLAATVGATRLVGSFPVGALSDRVGRKAVLVAGGALFGAAFLLFTVPSDPWLLAGPRVLLGLAMLATFPLGVAYIAGTVSPRRRTLAISVYVSAQGLGYALGPLLGSWLASAYGYELTYRVAAGIALAAAAAAARRLRREPPGPAAARPLRLRRLPRDLAAPAVANVAVMLMFSGAVTPFLSLYAARLGLGVFAVGALYAARAAASVSARLPAGLLARRLPNARLAVAAVALDAAAALGVAASGSAAPLVAAALADGVAFGVFLSAGQSLVAERAPPGRQGAAIGAFAAAGALGETAGALGFGVLAHLVSLRAVFVVAGAALAAAAAASSRLLGEDGVSRGRARSAPRA